VPDAADETDAPVDAADEVEAYALAA